METRWLRLAQPIAEQIFALHPKIRWAGLVTNQGDVLFVAMRPGVKSITPTETDRWFMELGPMLLSGVCERLIPWAGPLDSVVARYQKFIMITTKLPGHYLCVTINERDANEIQDVLNALRTFKNQ